MDIFLQNLVPFLLSLLVLFVLFLGIKVVPQSKVFIIERFGKYNREATSGLKSSAGFTRSSTLIYGLPPVVMFIAELVACFS